jgi:hypothetical protein
MRHELMTRAINNNINREIQGLTNDEFRGVIFDSYHTLSENLDIPQSNIENMREIDRTLQLYMTYWMINHVGSTIEDFLVYVYNSPHNVLSDLYLPFSESSAQNAMTRQRGPATAEELRNNPFFVLSVRWFTYLFKLPSRNTDLLLEDEKVPYKTGLQLLTNYLRDIGFKIENNLAVPINYTPPPTANPNETQYLSFSQDYTSLSSSNSFLPPPQQRASLKKDSIKKSDDNEDRIIPNKNKTRSDDNEGRIIPNKKKNDNDTLDLTLNNNTTIPGSGQNLSKLIDKTNSDSIIPSSSNTLISPPQSNKKITAPPITTKPIQKPPKNIVRIIKGKKTVADVQTNPFEDVVKPKPIKGDFMEIENPAPIPLTLANPHPAQNLFDGNNIRMSVADVVHINLIQNQLASIYNFQEEFFQYINDVYQNNAREINILRLFENLIISFNRFSQSPTQVTFRDLIRLYLDNNTTYRTVVNEFVAQLPPASAQRLQNLSVVADPAVEEEEEKKDVADGMRTVTFHTNNHPNTSFQAHQVPDLDTNELMTSFHEQINSVIIGINRSRAEGGGSINGANQSFSLKKKAPLPQKKISSKTSIEDKFQSFEKSKVLNNNLLDIDEEEGLIVDEPVDITKYDSFASDDQIQVDLEKSILLAANEINEMSNKKYEKLKLVQTNAVMDVVSLGLNACSEALKQNGNNPANVPDMPGQQRNQIINSLNTPGIRERINGLLQNPLLNDGWVDFVTTGANYGESIMINILKPVNQLQREEISALWNQMWKLFTSTRQQQNVQNANRQIVSNRLASRPLYYTFLVGLVGVVGGGSIYAIGLIYTAIRSSFNVPNPPIPLNPQPQQPTTNPLQQPQNNGLNPSGSGNLQNGLNTGGNGSGLSNTSNNVNGGGNGGAGLSGGNGGGVIPNQNVTNLNDPLPNKKPIDEGFIPFYGSHNLTYRINDQENDVGGWILFNTIEVTANSAKHVVLNMLNVSEPTIFGLPRSRLYIQDLRNDKNDNTQFIVECYFKDNYNYVD